MHLNIIALLPPFIALSVSAKYHAQPTPRSIDAILVEPSPSPTPFPRNLDLQNSASTSPYLKHLDLRQVAPAANQPAAAQPADQPAAAPADQPAAGAGVAPANQAGAAPADQPAAPVAGQGNAPPEVPAPAPAPAAPVAGVGGGGAPQAQPAPGAQANPVTTMMIDTVIGGVKTQVQKVFTQSFGVGGSAPSVMSGSIGMGTLTGKIGVVKTNSAKSDAIPRRDNMGRRCALLGIIGSWVTAMTLGGVLLGSGMI